MRRSRQQHTPLYAAAMSESEPPSVPEEPAARANRPAKLETYRDADYAADYDRRWRGSRGSRRDARKAAAIRRAWSSVATAAGEAPRTALDLPAGTGRFTRLAGELLGTAAAGPSLLISADLSREMLGEARKKDRDVNACVADAAALPFADRSIDLVLCIRFLHLVRDPQLRVAFLREFARVARLGVIVDYRHDRTFRIWGKKLRHRLGLLDKAPANPSPQQIVRELDAAGLTILGRHPVRAIPWVTDKLLLSCRQVRSIS